MSENLYETQYVITKKNKFQKFYDDNKILILSCFFVALIFTGSIIYYLHTKEEKKIFLAENYAEAKIYLKNGSKEKAKEILNTIILANDSTYSTLSLFLMINENIFSDQKELLSFFDHILENNKYDKEIKNLIIFKKALYQSDFVDYNELTKSLNPLIKNDSIWKPHALLLLGDYFYSKEKNLDAKNYYLQVLSLKNLDIKLYDYAQSQLMLIKND